MSASYSKILKLMSRLRFPQEKLHDHTILLTLDNHCNDNPLKLGQANIDALKKTNGTKRKTLVYTQFLRGKH